LEQFEAIEVEGNVSVELRSMERKEAFAERREDERTEMLEDGREEFVG